jgi:hypothetical protein
MMRVKADPLKRTAQAAVGKGWFTHAPSPQIIGRLVDFAVPHSDDEIAAGRGFDFETLEKEFRASWTLVWSRTYNFMGYFYEGNLPLKWRHVCHEMALKFPKDGANFCTIWKRTNASSPSP